MLYILKTIEIHDLVSYYKVCVLKIDVYFLGGYTSSRESSRVSSTKVTHRRSCKRSSKTLVTRKTGLSQPPQYWSFLNAWSGGHSK